MLGLILAAVIALAMLADVDAPFRQLDLDLALPPLPDNVAAYEPTLRERMAYKSGAVFGIAGRTTTSESAGRSNEIAAFPRRALVPRSRNFTSS
jgi:hypothetical protein